MKVCILCSSLRNYAGAERVVYEVSREVIRKGHSLVIGCIDPGDFYFHEMKGIILRDKAEELEEYYDVIINFHWPSYPFFFPDKIKYKKLVSFCLSPYEPNEFPNLLIDSDLFVFNSEESAESFFSQVKYDEEIKKDINSTIFPNSLNLSEYPIRESVGQLNKILLVSNHIPPELSYVIDMFRAIDILVDVIGFDHEQKMVNSASIINADLVISIGYTVVMAMASGIPVYVYDHMGGRGFLSGSIDRDFKYNFSGRPFGKKSSSDIFYEIIYGFEKAKHNSQKIIGHVREHHDISVNVDKILNIEQVNNRIKESHTHISLKKFSESYVRMFKTFRFYELFYLENRKPVKVINKSEGFDIINQNQSLPQLNKALSKYTKKVAVMLMNNIDLIFDKIKTIDDSYDVFYIKDEDTNIEKNIINVGDFFSLVKIKWQILITDSSFLLSRTDKLKLENKYIYLNPIGDVFHVYDKTASYIVDDIVTYYKLLSINLTPVLLEQPHNYICHDENNYNNESKPLLIISDNLSNIKDVSFGRKNDDCTEIWLVINSYDIDLVARFYVDKIFIAPSDVFLNNIIKQSDKIVVDSDNLDVIQSVLLYRRNTADAWIKSDNSKFDYKLSYVNRFDFMSFHNDIDFLHLKSVGCGNINYLFDVNGSY